jgi:hypothetical protein
VPRDSGDVVHSGELHVLVARELLDDLRHSLEALGDNDVDRHCFETPHERIRYPSKWVSMELAPSVDDPDRFEHLIYGKLPS